MKLEQIRDLFRGRPSGGFLNSDQRESNEFIDYTINLIRGMALPIRFAKDRKKPAIWMQEYAPEYSKDFQDGTKGKIQFTLPDVINLGATDSGYGYIGGTECNFQFRIWTDRSEFTSAMQDRLMNPASGRTSNVLFEGSRHVEIYSLAKVTTPPKFIGVYANPMEIPTYNMLTDEYPVDELSLKEMLNIFDRTDLMILTKSFVDRIKNSRDDTAIVK